MLWLGLPGFLVGTAWILTLTGLGPATSFSAFLHLGQPGWQPISTYTLVSTLFIPPFFVISFWVLISPLRQMIRGRRTVYAITNRRAFILRRGWRGALLTNIQSSEIKELTSRPAADGSGDIVFGACYGPRLLTEAMLSSSFLAASKPGGAAMPPVFFGVRDVRHVESLLHTLGEHARPTAGPTAPEGLAPAMRS